MFLKSFTIIDIMQQKRQKTVGSILLLRGRYFLLPLVSALLLFCDNPFFPATGDPPLTSSQRSTPQGVLRQLITAYEQQRIDLYMDLFSSAHDFRFYVSPAFAVDPQGYQKRFGPRPCEPVDSMCLYVKNNINDTCFNYWNYDEEMQSAENMFRQATLINFQTPPTISNNVRYITNGNNETTHVEIVMEYGTIIVDGEIYIDSSGQQNKDEWTVYIDKQVFYLERDADNPGLWVIQKWFDLSILNEN